MSTLKTLVESWVAKNKKTVKRNDLSYQQAVETTTAELERLLDLYRNTVFEEDMRARLLRDSIDHHIRRYHKYTIQGSIKSHYKQKNVSMDPKDCIFEHVIPAGQVRDMLIDQAITINQALNVPTCRVSKADNKRLNDLGLHKNNPEPYYPFRRYKTAMACTVNKKEVVPEFETYNGQAILDLHTWTLDDHFKQFNIE
jgi:hypothetical protein